MKSRLHTLCVLGGFLLLCGFYALTECGRAEWAESFAVALPAWFLSLAVVWRAPDRASRGIALALLFSGFGDLMGAKYNFLAQISFFAAAHLAYIASFLSRIRWRSFAYAGICVLLLVFVFLALRIVPHIDDPYERWFVLGYMVLIGGMGTSVVLQNRFPTAIALAAAILFISSDAMIAWSRFVERIPHATLWIMTTYYAAQYLFARCALSGHSLQKD